MNNSVLKKYDGRNPALDIIRCIACFGVIAIHFFYNNGLYDVVIADSKRLYAMVFGRSFFMYCVPLFMILSGYLLCHKTLSVNYYKRIGKIYFVYVAASLFCAYAYPFLYTRLANPLGLPYKEFSQVNFFSDVLLKTLRFTASPYAWYIEMYLGLFLIIPFANIIFMNLKSKKQRQLLLITGIILTALPTVINAYNFTVTGWWRNPTMLDANNNLYRLQKLMPEWWTDLYPLTYYFIGCYFREYKIKLKPWKSLLIIIVTAFVSGLFSLWRSNGVQFQKEGWSSFHSLFNVILSSFIFLFFINIDYSCLHKPVKILLSKLSELCLGAFLVSWVFDNLFYPVLAKKVPVLGNRIEYFFIIVPLVFVLSMLTSFVIMLLYNALQYAKKCGIRWISKERKQHQQSE